jgi:N-acetyl-anhydromuramyl-L-alanine amidase AmpD
MSTDGFPGAIWIPAHTDRYARRESRTVEEIVLHITEGGTDKADITAHNAFGGPKYLQGGKWMQQAAHYIVGRDGAVVQCVRHKDVAYHAGPANEWTIGIEHNTRSGSKLKDTKLTAAQYLKSAELVLWLCNMLGFSADRNHISGHSEADPSATHSSCPQRVLKWDTYMAAISDQRLIAQGGTPMRLWNDDEI